MCGFSGRSSGQQWEALLTLHCAFGSLILVEDCLKCFICLSNVCCALKRLLTSRYTLGVPSSGRAIATVGAEKYPLNLLAVVRAEGSVVCFAMLCAGPVLHSNVHQATFLDGTCLSLGPRLQATGDTQAMRAFSFFCNVCCTWQLVRRSTQPVPGPVTAMPPGHHCC
jgi:hypothetical protein